ISLVFESWRTSPFTEAVSRSAFGSTTSSFVTIYGPTGAKPSFVFPAIHCGVRFCISRADISFVVQYPKTYQVLLFLQYVYLFSPSQFLIQLHDLIALLYVEL